MLTLFRYRILFFLENENCYFKRFEREEKKSINAIK